MVETTTEKAIRQVKLLNEQRPLGFAATKYDPAFVARAAFLCVGAAMIANSLFNLIAIYHGIPHPYSTFLFLPQDRFADFFKLALSYPGASIAPTASFWGMEDRLTAFQDVLQRLAGTRLNHFHVPPLPTLMALCWRQAMVAIDPVLLFVIFTATGLAILAMVTAQVTEDAATKIRLRALAVLNYPAAFMIDRGHFFSLICTIALIAVLLRSDRRTSPDWLTIVLLAVVLNIRPNAGVFPLALFLCRRGWSLADMVCLGALTLGIFAAALVLSHGIYPAYDLTTFREGLRDYSIVYITSDFGLAYGSSLFGALKALFGFSGFVYWLPPIVGFILLAGAVIAQRQRRIGYAAFVYVTAATYCLAGQVFADYHLMIFLAPVVLLMREGGLRSGSDWAVFLGCCFVLAPKNYFFHPYEGSPLPWSWQIIANPLVLLITSAFVLWRTFGRTRHVEATAEETPPRDAPVSAA